MVHKAAMAKQLIPYIETLTEMQRIFVEGVLRGLTDVAAATAAGVTNPRANAHKLRKHPAVAEAIKKGKEMFARDVFFDRKKAHDMLVDAHSNAETTTEQVLAIREMIKLHGIAAPEVKEIHQTISGKVEHSQLPTMTDNQLLELADLPDDQLPAIIDGEFEEVPLVSAKDSEAAGS